LKEVSSRYQTYPGGGPKGCAKEKFADKIKMRAAFITKRVQPRQATIVRVKLFRCIVVAIGEAERQIILSASAPMQD
jgi:hypothetical protein